MILKRSSVKRADNFLNNSPAIEWAGTFFSDFGYICWDFRYHGLTNNATNYWSVVFLPDFNMGRISICTRYNGLMANSISSVIYWKDYFGNLEKAPLDLL